MAELGGHFHNRTLVLNVQHREYVHHEPMGGARDSYLAILSCEEFEEH